MSRGASIWKTENDAELRKLWADGTRVITISEHFGVKESVITHHTRRLNLPKRRPGRHEGRMTNSNSSVGPALGGELDERRMLRDANRGSEELLNALRKHHTLEGVINVR